MKLNKNIRKVDNVSDYLLNHIIEYNSPLLIGPAKNSEITQTVNPFKLSGVKWLHLKVFRAILV